MTVCTIRVNIFPGGFNWPLFAALELGLFAREQIAVEVQATKGSVAQMTDFAAGRFDIAMTGFDNIVAYVEGQGEAPIGAQPDFFAFLGSDNSFLKLVGQADIESTANLRGRAISVDAATTGYAFALYDLLGEAGLGLGDYSVVKLGGMAQRFEDLCRGGHAATMLSAPYDLLAARAGLRVFAAVADPYQGNVGAARRSWAKDNAGAVEAYIRAYCASLEWLYEPANRAQACAILMRHVAGMSEDLAATSYSSMLGPNGGFSPDGRIGEEGVRRVLALRSRYAPAQTRLTRPEKYSDLRYWERAMRRR